MQDVVIRDAVAGDADAMAFDHRPHRPHRLHRGWVADGAVSTEEILGVVVTDVRYRARLAA